MKKSISYIDSQLSYKYKLRSDLKETDRKTSRQTNVMQLPSALLAVVAGWRINKWIAVTSTSCVSVNPLTGSGRKCADSSV